MTNHRPLTSVESEPHYGHSKQNWTRYHFLNGHSASRDDVVDGNRSIICDAPVIPPCFVYGYADEVAAFGAFCSSSFWKLDFYFNSNPFTSYHAPSGLPPKPCQR